MPEAPGTAACIVDTSAVIDFLRGRSYAAQLMQAIAREGDIAISAVTHAEVFAAVQPDVEEVTGEVLAGFITFEVTPQIARRAGTMLNQLRFGSPADVADALIAATAIEYDLPLLTAEIDRYRFPGLNVVRAQNAARRLSPAPRPAAT